MKSAKVFVSVFCTTLLLISCDDDDPVAQDSIQVGESRVLGSWRGEDLYEISDDWDIAFSSETELHLVDEDERFELLRTP